MYSTVAPHLAPGRIGPSSSSSKALTALLRAMSSEARDQTRLIWRLNGGLPRKGREVAIVLWLRHSKTHRAAAEPPQRSLSAERPLSRSAVQHLGARPTSGSGRERRPLRHDERTGLPLRRTTAPDPRWPVCQKMRSTGKSPKLTTSEWTTLALAPLSRHCAQAGVHGRRTSKQPYARAAAFPWLSRAAQRNDASVNGGAKAGQWAAQKSASSGGRELMLGDGARLHARSPNSWRVPRRVGLKGQPGCLASGVG